MTRAPRTARTHLAATLLLMVGMVALVCDSGCSYDPHPADGKVGCSANGECPQGYTCRYPSATCFSDTTGAGMGSGGTSGGTGTGGATISVNASDYVGEWAFGPAATVAASCDDGSSDSTALLSESGTVANMSITMDMSGLAVLRSVWLCDLLLNLDSAGAHLGPGNHTCIHTKTVNDPPGAPQSQTWTTTKFELSVTKRDRGTAAHVAEYTRVDAYSATDVVTCHQVVRSGLQKL